VPLSEHERRQFEQIEQALRADDPRFADAVRAADPRVHYKHRLIEAVLGFLIGVGLLLAGVVINVVLIAVAGFVVMLACSLWAVASYQRMTSITTGRVPAKGRASGQGRRAAQGGASGQGRRAARGRRAGKQARSGLMERLGERWRRRQAGGR
jgi:predicted lipid-binding transport protein (Tim44 family)